MRAMITSHLSRLAVAVCTLVAASCASAPLLTAPAPSEQLSVPTGFADGSAEPNGNSFSWGASRRQASLLFSEGRWLELAEIVLSEARDQNLGNYYLGVSAARLGYTQAARVYLTKSIAQSEDNNTDCGAIFDLCSDIDLPEAAVGELANISANAQAEEEVTSQGEGAGVPNASETNFASMGEAKVPATDGGNSLGADIVLTQSGNEFDDFVEYATPVIISRTASGANFALNLIKRIGRRNPNDVRYYVSIRVGYVDEFWRHYETANDQMAKIHKLTSVFTRVDCSNVVSAGGCWYEEGFDLPIDFLSLSRHEQDDYRFRLNASRVSDVISVPSSHVNALLR